MKRRNAILIIIAAAIVISLVYFFIYPVTNALPRVVGADPKTGLKLVQISYCSDVCPQYTRTFIVFENVTTAEKCNEIGGQTIRDAAWHGYIGCRPKANASDPSEVFG
jgi:hypothetical protein